MVKGDANFLIEVRAEEGDLGVTLAEVVQHDEVGIHPHPHMNSLGGGAVAKKKARDAEPWSRSPQAHLSLLRAPRSAGRSLQKAV